jgi:predicted acyltransferase
MNSITIYLAQRFIDFDYTGRSLFGGLASLFPESFQPLILALAYIAVCWGFLYLLYRQRIFLKV